MLSIISVPPSWGYSHAFTHASALSFDSLARLKLTLCSCLLFGLCRTASAETKLFALPRQHADPAKASQVGRTWLLPQHPRLLFADIPFRYQKDLAQTYGFQALGRHLSVEHELWDSQWHQIDLWFIDQFRSSPLRTYNETEADFVFVPASLAILDTPLQASTLGLLYDPCNIRNK